MNTTSAEVVHLCTLMCVIIFEVYMAIVVVLRSGDVSSLQRLPQSWKGIVRIACYST